MYYPRYPRPTYTRGVTGNYSCDMLDTSQECAIALWIAVAVFLFALLVLLLHAIFRK